MYPCLNKSKRSYGAYIQNPIGGARDRDKQIITPVLREEQINKGII